MAKVTLPVALPLRTAGYCVAVSMLWLAPHVAAQQSPSSGFAGEDLRVYAVHIHRTPVQEWPGYGMYLGNGLILTAAHVPGNFADTKPRAIVAGADRPTTLVKQGSLNGTDLTLLSVDPGALPVRMRMRRLPLCAAAPFAGEDVLVVTPETAARSHVLPHSAVPPDLRGRFDTLIGDVATTGNSGSGVLDSWKGCLLGIISRKISLTRPGVRPGARPTVTDIAKYFVPVRDIRAFLPADATF